MRFSELAGQNAMTAQLVRSVQTGRTVHAHILEGPAGSGKRTLASICASALVCEATERERPCGVCPGCMRAAAGNHPDITIIRPEVEKGRERAVGVETVRSVIDKIAVRPYEGGYGIVIFEKAGMLTIQAQNALLKTLETPPENTIFLLLTESVAALLTTVVSRCRVTRMPVLTRAEVCDVLCRRGIDPIRAASAADLSFGCVGLGRKAAEDAEYTALADRALQAISTVHQASDVPEAMRIIRDDRDRAGDLLTILEQTARDIMLQENGVRPFAEGRTAFYASARFSGQKLLSAVLTAKRRLKGNVSYQSCMELMLLAMVH